MNSLKDYIHAYATKGSANLTVAIEIHINEYVKRFDLSNTSSFKQISSIDFTKTMKLLFSRMRGRHLSKSGRMYQWTHVNFKGFDLSQALNLKIKHTCSEHARWKV